MTPRTQHCGARTRLVVWVCALVVLFAPVPARGQFNANEPAVALSERTLSARSSATVTSPVAPQLGLLPELSLRRVLAGRLGRLAVYFALFLAVGAIGISAIAVPRLRRSHVDEADAFPTMLDGMALTVGVVAGFLLVVSTLLRTILQFTDSNEIDPTLTLAHFLTDPGMGRSLAFSTVVAALVAVSAAMARQYRHSEVWRALEIAAVVLFIFFWASSGHSNVAKTFFGISADFPLVIHILAAGIWIGSLAVVFVTVLPLALTDPARLPLLRATVQSLSGTGFVSVGVLVVTGLLNAMAQMDSLSQLTSSRYGQTLLVKLVFVALLLAAGAYNWRVVKPKLHDIAGALKLRSTIRTELLLAGFVLVVTSVLVATVVP